ncbi:hypothetical protein ACFJGV_15235 [Cnuibacter sp. UC19_7]|uniref:hypothetical protein n=1 Tax=Cnuibacter sp. UC19_7 TaxID=3350166 RepID=UPI00366B9F92
MTQEPERAPTVRRKPPWWVATRTRQSAVIATFLWSFIFILQAVFLIIELHDNGEAAWFRWAVPVLNLVIVVGYFASVVYYTRRPDAETY